MKIRLPQYSSNDNYIMLFVMLPLTLVLNSILFGKLYFSSITIFTLATLISGTGACIDFIICGYIAVALKKRFPLEKQVAKRLTLMILAFFIVTGLFLYTLFHGYEAIHFYGYRFYEAGFIWCYVAMGIMNIFITLIQEGASRYEDWKKNMEETDALKASFRQSQLQGLKSQVNPHFLFNSFNTLISTIEDDPKNAAEYATQLSDFFRNVVNQRDKDIISLKDEINSLHTYFYLQQKRYGSNLKCEINISDVQQETYMIPPLTLQLLVENAVKHNAVSKETPLLISLFISDEKYLDISNNINPKINKAGGAGMGLQNIINRYRLLTDTPVKVYNDQEYFIVSLPLLR